MIETVIEFSKLYFKASFTLILFVKNITCYKSTVKLHKNFLYPYRGIISSSSPKSKIRTSDRRIIIMKTKI